MKGIMKMIKEYKPDAADPSTCFNCNICFDCAREPVVTFCGHLYCWPCIYGWLKRRNRHADINEFPQCPLCKARISWNTMVPIYGCGQVKTELEARAVVADMRIPPRPGAYRHEVVWSRTDCQYVNELISELAKANERSSRLQGRLNRYKNLMIYGSVCLTILGICVILKDE